MKTINEDGLWKRKTHYGKHEIDIVIWRTPHCWEAEAVANCGRVSCGGTTAFQATRMALKNLRMNIPIWSNFKRGVCYI
jgi:hypothetical protein